MGFKGQIPEGTTFSQAARLVAEVNHRNGQRLGRIGAYSFNRTQACWLQAAALDWEGFSDRTFERWPDGIKAVGTAFPISIDRLRQICSNMEKTEQSTYYWVAGASDGTWLDTPPNIRPCSGCGRFFYLSDVRRTVCNGCRAKTERDKKRRQRGTDLSTRACSRCGATFTPKRSTAQFCSTRCRVAAHRATTTRLGILEP